MGILCTGFITPLKIWLQGFFMCPQECLMSLQLKFNFRLKKGRITKKYFLPDFTK